MKITFNLQGTGLGNNGGSATIVNSANVLTEFGQQVSLILDEKNKLTWFSLSKKVKIVMTEGQDYPNADVLIATGAKSVLHVLEAPEAKGEKYWYIRAHEIWVMSEAELFELYKNSNITLLVNSIHLQKFLRKKVKRDSMIFRPGQDLDKFYPTVDRDWGNKKEWVLGGLYNTKPRKRFRWVIEIYEQLEHRNIPVRLKLFGTEELSIDLQCIEYLYQPDKEELRNFYNSIDFWIAPTKSEGLHIPPQEIMLTEGIVFGANEELSGMDDYLIHNQTGMRFSHWSEAVSILLDLIKDKEKMKALSKQGRRKIVQLDSREENMKKMVNYFEADLV